MIGIWRPVWGYSVLSVVSVAVCYGWLMTLMGLNVTLRGLSYCLPGRFSVEGVKGCLAGPIQFKQVSYQDKGSQWTLTDFYMDSKKSALLKGRWHIKNLRVANLQFMSQATDHSMPYVASLWKRLRIDRAEIKSATFKTGDWQLQAQGAIGGQETLEWCVQGYGLQWQGTLKTDWAEDGFMQLMAHSLPTVIGNKKIPALQMTGQYQQSNWWSRLTIKDSKKPANYINLSSVVVHRLFGKSPMKLQLAARLEDFASLQAMGLPLKKYIAIQTAGPITMDIRLQSTFQQLIRMIQYPERYLLGKEIWNPSSMSAELSMDWKDPKLIPWGAFSHCHIHGKLHHHHIAWEAQLADSLQPISRTAPGQWRFMGETRWVLSKADRLYKECSLWNRFDVVTHLTLRGDSVAFFTNTAYALSAAPKLDITIRNRHIHLCGQAYMPRARFQLERPMNAVMPDSDIYFVQSDQTMGSTAWPLDIQVNLALGPDVYLYYAGLKARLEGSLALKKKNEQPMMAKGEIRMVEGDYYYLGQALQLEPNARLIFTERLYAPSIDIEASRAIYIKPSNRLFSIFPLHYSRAGTAPIAYSTTDTRLPLPAKVGVHLRGDLEAPSMHLFSKPSGWITDPADTLSYIITGQPVNSLKGAAVPLLLNTAAQLGSGYISYYGVLSDFYKKFGIAMDLQSDELSENTHLILSKPLTSQIVMLWKEGFMKPEHAFGLSALIGKHMMTSASFDFNKAAGGLDMIYQREWE
jgi:hypothetical protein